MINMKQGLFFGVFVLLTVSCSLLIYAEDSDTLFVGSVVSYDLGNVSFSDTEIVQMEESVDVKRAGCDYTLNVYSFKEELLFETSFGFPLYVLPSPSDRSDPYVLNHSETAVFVPYFNNMHTFMVYDKDGNFVAGLDVSELAVCNQNSYCDGKENIEVCPEDCSGTDNESDFSGKYRQLGLIVLACIIVAVVLIVIGLKKLKNKKIRHLGKKKR